MTPVSITLPVLGENLYTGSKEAFAKQGTI